MEHSQYRQGLAGALEITKLLLHNRTFLPGVYISILKDPTLLIYAFPSEGVMCKNCTFLRGTTWWFDIHTHGEMITTAKLVNIPHIVTLGGGCLREAGSTWNLLWANFQCSIQYLLLTIVSMLCTKSLDLLILQNCNLYPLTNISLFSLPLCAY